MNRWLKASRWASALVAAAGMLCLTYDHLHTPLPHASHLHLARTVQSKPHWQDDERQVQVWQVVPQVFLLHFNDQAHLAGTFLRFQEHYESPRFRGKVFTFEEFEDWYRTARGESLFSYAHDWSGFNFPSSNLEPFYAGKFDPLSRDETWLLDLFSPLKGEKFYIIATVREPSYLEGLAPIRHELAHALFFLDPEYQKEVQELLSQIESGNIHNVLNRQAGYHPSVLDDETHAYLMNEEDFLTHNGIDLKLHRGIISSLNRAFEAAFRRWQDRPGLLFPREDD